MGIIKLIKNYRELGNEEFMRRFKEGFEMITPTQQVKSQLLGNWIVLIGIIVGIIVNIIVKVENQWFWILIILGGSFFLTLVGMIGLYQKYNIFKKQDEIINQLNREQEVTSNNGTR